LPANDLETLRAARLTRAAYDVALTQGIRGAFPDFELRLWKAMREVVRTEPDASARIVSSPR